MLTADPASSAQPREASGTGRPVAPNRFVNGLVALLIAFFAAADIGVLYTLREEALAGAERSASVTALILAEQAERAIQGIGLVLDDAMRYAESQGANTPENFDRVMSDAEANATLRRRTVGLPQVGALLAISLSGDVVNSSRYWPVPRIDVRDRNYFKAIMASPGRDLAISEPLTARGTGAWTILLARKMYGPDGEPTGLLAAAIELKYFEEFYRAVSRDGDTATVLLRDDGLLLARYPPAGVTGRNFQAVSRILGNAESGTIRELSPIDGSMRVKAARRVKSYPLATLISVDEASILREWRQMAWLLSLATAGCAFTTAISALLLERRWRHRDALSRERESRALAEAELMRERESNAEADSRAKSSFLATMSHEIRTPMNGVLGLAASLLETPLNARQREMIESIRDSGVSLSRILNDALDYSRLSAGRMQLEESPFSPAALTRNVGALLGPSAESKGLRLSTVCDPDLPAALLGDSGRIGQVLLNLIGNAVKFTERGSVSVRASCQGLGENGIAMVWRVSDTGIGIAPDRLEGLFAEFVQADTSIARRFGGSGLGLAISKQLIAQMGGTISVVSTVGMGSEFQVSLTLPPAELTAEDMAMPDGICEAFEAFLRELERPARILFAEDNSTNQFVAVQAFQGLDVQIDLVGNGVEAVEAASRRDYDAICMDMRMPEMDGLAATRAIRARGGRLATVPIVALTANAFPRDVEACLEAGMTDFISKPARKETLLAVLLKALVPGGGAVPLSAAAPWPVPDDRPLDLKEFALFAAAVGHPKVLELREDFENETKARFETISNPHLARDTLIWEVHSLNGAAAAFFAVTLRRRAADLEQRLIAGAALTPDDLAGLSEAFETWRAAVRDALAGEQAAA